MFFLFYSLLNFSYFSTYDEISFLISAFKVKMEFNFIIFSSDESC